MKQNKILTMANIFYFLILFLISITKADLPVHCLVEDVAGEWTLRINKEKFDAKAEDEMTSCGHGLPNQVGEGFIGDYLFETFEDLKLTLDRNYKVYQGGVSVGSWTPVYDQSFVIFYKNSVITAPYRYYQNDHKEFKSECSKSMIGWYIPDKNNNIKNWSCFFAFKSKSFLGSNSFLQMQTKTEKEITPQLSFAQISLSNKINKSLKYEHLNKVVNEINNANLLWKAEVHEEFKGLSFVELRQKLGLQKNYSNNKNYAFFLNQAETQNNLKTNLIQINKNEKNALDEDLQEFFKKLDAKTEMLTSNNEVSNKNKNYMKTTNYMKNDESEKNLNKRLEDEEEVNEAIPVDENRDKDSFSVNDYNEISKYINLPLENIPEDKLPRNWDWRNVGGVSYIPKIKRQGNCGSCYVFSTVTSLEGRLRVMTNNKDTTEFSKQYPLSCNFYSEGCEGGYPFLVGKFFNEFEIVPEECYPYTQSNGTCKNVCEYNKLYQKKYKVKEYGYLGGYYGATSELLMMKELRARGPIPGNIRVPYTFNYYKNGIFSHSEINKNSKKFNKTTMVDRNLSWEKVEHSITLVGYGEEKGVKFWIGMNTWGPDWGENGFFRILRGENECSIESMGDIVQLEIISR